jgi:hypothetical protein
MAIDLGAAKKVLSQSFTENHENIDEDSAKDLIAKCLKKIKALQEEMSQNERLQAAKQIVKDLESGYKSTVKYEEAKITFLLDKIEEIESGDVNPESGANL